MAREDFGAFTGTFITPFQGVLSESSKEPKEGFSLIEYKDKEGNERTKYVKKYSSISGIITGFDYKSNEFNGRKINSWNIKIKDDQGTMIIQLSTETRVCQSFLKMLPNIDLGQEIKIATFLDKEKGSTVIMASQDGEKIKWYYTKEEPNGMPEAKLRSTGKWDFAEVEDFLFEKAQEFSAEVAEMNNYVEDKPAYDSTPTYANKLDQHMEQPGSIEEDDIPF